MTTDFSTPPGDGGGNNRQSTLRLNPDSPGVPKNLERIYRDPFEWAKATGTSFIKQVAPGTGLGKTYSAVEFAKNALFDHYQNGPHDEGVVGFYSSTQTKHLSDFPTIRIGPEGQKVIPQVREFSRHQQQTVDDPDGVYHWVRKRQYRSGSKQLFAVLSRLVGAQDPKKEIARGGLAEFEPESENTATVRQNPVKVAREAFYSLDRYYRQLTEEDRAEPTVQNTLTNKSRALYSAMERVTHYLMNDIERPDGSAIYLSDQDLYEIYRPLRDTFFPMFAIQAGPYAYQLSDTPRPIGLLASTTSKLIYRRKLFVQRSEYEIDKGYPPWRAINGSLENLAAGHVAGKPLWPTPHIRVVMLIDEADDAHKAIEADEQFSGKLLSQSYPTQSMSSIARETQPVLYNSDADDKALSEAIQDVRDHGWNDAKGAQLAGVLNRLSGGVNNVHTLQEMRALREQRLNLRAIVNDTRKRLSGGKPINDANTRAILERAVQGSLCITIDPTDPQIKDFGSGGFFTAGPLSLMDMTLANPFVVDLRVRRHTMIVSDYHHQKVTHFSGSQANDGDAVGFDEFIDLILESVALLAYVSTARNTNVKTLRKIFLNDEHLNGTHNAPTSDIMSTVAKTSYQEILAEREPLDPEENLDRDGAFKNPHLMISLTPVRYDRSTYQASLNAAIAKELMPCITFRRTTPTHWLETLINPQWANSESCRNAIQGHVAFLMSATGGGSKIRVDGFHTEYLRQSEAVAMMPMTEADIRDTRVMRQQRARRTGTPWVSHYRDGHLIDGDEGSGIWNYAKKILEGDPCIKAMNRHKEREAKTVFDALWLMMAGNKDGPREKYNESAQAVSRHDRHTGIVFTQTIRHVRAIMRRAEKIDECQIIKPIIPNVLYAFDTRGLAKYEKTSPALVVLYDRGTDKALKNFADEIVKKANTEEREQLLDMLGISAESDAIKARFGSISGLLRTDTQAKVLVVTPYSSGGRGINLKVNSGPHPDGKARPRGYKAPQERDIDMAILAMSPYYSSASGASPGDNQEDKVLKEMLKTLWSAQWAVVQDDEDVSLRNKDLRPHADEKIPGAAAMLRDEHRKLLVNIIIQALGRTERRPHHDPKKAVWQEQAIILCKEVVNDLVRGYPLLYGEDGDPELLDAASVNTRSVFDYIRTHQSAIFWTPETEGEQEAWLSVHEDAIDAYRDEKMALVGAFKAVREGSLSPDERDRIIEQWTAFRHPDWLFNPKRYEQRLEAAGFSDAFRESLWADVPSNVAKEGRLAVRQTNFGHEALQTLVIDPDDLKDERNITSGLVRAYNPDEALGKLWLPEALAPVVKLMYGYDKLHLEPKPTNGFRRIQRPHWRDDRKGVWGEFATWVWLSSTFSDLGDAYRPLSLGETAPVIELFDGYIHIESPRYGAVLLAFDAKHYQPGTDRRQRQRLKKKIAERYEAVRDWAEAMGFERAVCVYVNTYPVWTAMDKAEQIAVFEDEDGYPLPDSPYVLALNAFRQQADTDAIADPNEPTYGANGNGPFNRQCLCNFIAGQELRRWAYGDA